MLLILTKKFNVIKFHFKKQISMSLISTIFIVFIMSLTTQFLLNISNHNISEINIIIQGQRALFAAKSGVTWGITNTIINQTCPNQTTINLNQSGLTGFTVNVSCNFIDSNIIKITATANYENIGSNNYVTRTVIGKYKLNYPKV